METEKEIKYVGWILSSLFALFIIGIIILNFAISPADQAQATILSDLIHGDSMAPTINDGDYVKYDTSQITPKAGEIVIFKCFTEKCINGDTKYGKLKRLVKIDDRGCYWFEGDNKNHSWDSRNYGWLCPPDDIEINGTVIGYEDRSVQTQSTASTVNSVKPEPIKPVVKKPVATQKVVPVEKGESYEDSHSKELLDEYRENQKQIEQEEKERDAYYAKIEADRKARLAEQQRLAEQKKLQEQADAQKKYEQCRRDLQYCMSSISSKVMQYSGSARDVATRAYEDSCNRQYDCD